MPVSCQQKLLLTALLLATFLSPALSLGQATPNIQERPAPQLLKLDNQIVQVGIDKSLGASITWLSSKEYPSNMVNIHDPGRLIQQSYYAGDRLDRSAEGQTSHWTPWTWNPIQGGGTHSWARVTVFETRENGTVLYSETIPKLWDMPNEEAQALMKQWTSLEPGLPNTIRVRNQLICQRNPNDRWGPGKNRHQELPALYFTRNFDRFQNYLGNGKWEKISENRKEDAPWSKSSPPLQAMASLNENGQGIGIYCPSAGNQWNFGPHGEKPSADPRGGPCSHIAPLATIQLGPTSTLTYRYWMILGTEEEIAQSFDTLMKQCSKQTILLTP